MRYHLLIIDPQNDFVDPEQGALAVPGAVADMERLASWITRHADELEQIHITLDTHHSMDISHPPWWRCADGSLPAPFTQVTPDDVRSGRIRTADPAHTDRTLAYLEALSEGGRYGHTIWPEHCLQGQPGHAVWPALTAALDAWSRPGRTPSFIEKGENPWTEHFSAFRAEVPDPSDPSTQVNQALIDALHDADIIVVAGEARSHCVAHTVRDLVRQAPQLATKICLLEDAMSDVGDPPGTTLFSDLGRAFITDMLALGVRTTQTNAPLPVARHAT